MRTGPVAKFALFFFFVVFGMAGAARAFGVGDVGTTSAAFLKLGSGARSEAMGEAYVGLADDADGIAYNPAGMAQNLSGELSASDALWFQGLNYDNFGAMLPSGDGGVLGAAFDYLSTPQIARTLLVGDGNNPDPGQNYVEDGSFSPYDLLADLAYARPVGYGLLAGAGLKLIDQSIDTDSSFGLGLDLGLLWRAPIAGLSAGLSLQNMGTPIRLDTEAFDLPFIARGGAAYRLLNGALVLSVEGDLPQDASPVLAVGAEYDIADRFYPRVGWRYDDEFNPWTLGFGLRYDGWGLDLSAVPYGALGMTYRASLDWRFGGPTARLGARLAYASTLGPGKPVVLDAGTTAPDQVQAWAVYIYDSGRPARLVRVLNGDGPPPHALDWDARDQAALPVPEGTYWAVLSVRYAAGQTIDSPYLRLRVDNSAPAAGLSLDPDSLNPGAAGEAFVPTGFRTQVTSTGAVAAWRLDILDPNGKVFRSIGGDGAPPALVVWDGKGDQGDELVSAQVYSARLWVKDALDHEGASPAPVSFKAVFRWGTAQ
jgi:hypothetical protein